MNKLVDDGYVDLRQGQEDKRQRLLSLTSKGRELEAELTAVQKRRFSKATKRQVSPPLMGFSPSCRNA